MSENANDKTWVAPLIKSIISAAPIGPIASITCPLCDCDHQQFQGSGVLMPSKGNSGKLICAFPTAETLVKIDLPELPVAGITHYTRYHCLCGDHNWAVITAFHEDKTVVWCVEIPLPHVSCTHKKSAKALPPPNLEEEETGLPVVPAVAQPGKNALQDMLTQLGFNSGTPPLIVISPALLKEMNPAAYAQLQKQLGGLNSPPIPPKEKVTLKLPPTLPPYLPTTKQAKKAQPPKLEVTDPDLMKPLAQDHEHPLVMLPPVMNLRFQSWLVGERIDGNGLLPVIPTKIKAKNKAQHRVAGAVDSGTLKAMTEWLFMLSVELKDVSSEIHAFVYWHTTLLVVVDDNYDSKDKTLFKIVTEGIINLAALKPTNVILISRAHYEELRAFKEAKANEGSSPS